MQGYPLAADASFDMDEKSHSAKIFCVQKGMGKMKKYGINGQLEIVICNCCGKKLIVKDGIVREGVMMVDHVWDFFSEKDGEVHHWDMCEACYDQMICEFQVKPDMEEQVEFI